MDPNSQTQDVFSQLKHGARPPNAEEVLKKSESSTNEHYSFPVSRYGDDRDDSVSTIDKTDSGIGSEGGTRGSTGVAPMSEVVVNSSGIRDNRPRVSAAYYSDTRSSQLHNSKTQEYIPQAAFVPSSRRTTSSANSGYSARSRRATPYDGIIEKLRTEIQQLQNQYADDQEANRPVADLFDRIYKKKEELEELEVLAGLRSARRLSGKDRYSSLHPSTIAELSNTKSIKSLLSGIEGQFFPETITGSELQKRDTLVRSAQWTFSLARSIIPKVLSLVIYTFILGMLCIASRSLCHSTFSLQVSNSPWIDLPQTSLWHAHSTQADLAARTRVSMNDTWYTHVPLIQENLCITYLDNQTARLAKLQHEEHMIIHSIHADLLPRIRSTITQEKPSLDAVLSLQETVALKIQDFAALDVQIRTHLSQPSNQEASVCANALPPGSMRQVKTALDRSRSGNAGFRLTLQRISDDITYLALLWLTPGQSRTLKMKGAWDASLLNAAAQL